MRAIPHAALWFAIGLTSLHAFASAADDGGGRDVSVALFSTHTLNAVTLTPLGSNTWTAHCAHCAHEPLKTPLHLAGPVDLFAGGTLRVADDASREERTATGLWHLRVTGENSEIDVVLTLPSERYVAAVLAAEAAPGEPSQSLRAMAVLARTYALNGEHFTAQPGHLSVALCDSTQCQAMRLGPVSQAIEDAVRDTAGETLWFGPHRAEVFFSQNCGGVTEDSGAAWPTLRGVPYLRSHPDPFCERRDKAAWHDEIPLTQLAQIAQREGWHLPAGIVAARVAELSPSRRALRLVFTGEDGATETLSASALRFGIGRALGWNQVRSDLYEIGVRNGSLIFDGRGHGHGVGLCQAGAAEMAVEGKNYREILAFYLPGTSVRILPSDDGWQQARSGSLSFRSTQPLSAERKAALERSWNEAERRFPPRSGMTAEIVFTPSTELFRQLTTQPGWALASTRGNRIVLQPASVLEAHGNHDYSTTLHEMLHVLIEAEASDRAPLWLREGLVEALAGDEGYSAQMHSSAEIDSALLHAESLRESQTAHLVAAARVRALLARYGLSAVRGWLTSGVPPGVS